ncbi:nuclear transport factor 2 family protein [Flavobacterium sp.]|uniref:nuclear transport factor 2 family protein n=1 Tax=Flavobacterium sp. TaxID=239 RepID=UPI0028BD8935|nr:nuclear transport factor 2 family protein [Flavobacterium sp.]
MTAKELVERFYQSDGFRNKEVMQEFLDDDLEFHWHSTKGFLKMDKTDLMELSKELNRSYTSSRVAFSHILEEGNSVTVRFAYFVTPIETPTEEQILAYFITIWEVADGKLFRGYQMSQLD